MTDQTTYAEKSVAGSRHALDMALLFILIILGCFIATFWGIRFTQTDDYHFALGALEKGAIQYGIDVAREYGRLQFFVSMPVVAWLDTLAMSQIYDALYLGAMALAVIVFGLTVGAYLGRPAALLAMLFYIGTAAIPWQQMLLTTTPVWFYGTFALGCFSLLALRQWHVRKNGFWLFISLACLFGSYISQEFYVPLAFLAWLMAYISLRPVDRGFIKWVCGRPVMLAVAISLVYGIAYVAFRLLNGTDYVGVQLTDASAFSWRGFVGAVVNFSFNSQALSFMLKNLSIPYVDAIEPTHFEIVIFPPPEGWQILLSPYYMAYGALVAAAGWCILRAPTLFITFWRAFCLFVFGLIFATLPSALQAMTPVYQEWALLGVPSCTYTLFSHFGFSLMIVALAAYILPRLPQFLRLMACLIACFVLFIVAAGAAYQNERVAEAMHRNTDRWYALDLVLRDHHARESMIGQTVWAPRLWSFYWSTPTWDDYWTRWAKARYGAATDLVRLPAGEVAPELWLDFASLPECNALVAVLAARAGDDGAIRNVRLVARGPETRISVNWVDAQGVPRARRLADLMPDANGVYYTDMMRSGDLHISCTPGTMQMPALHKFTFGQEIDLVSSMPAGAETGSGWSQNESTHRWTDGRQATLLLPSAPRVTGNVRATLKAAPLLNPPALAAQTARIIVNDVQVAELAVDQGSIGAFHAYDFMIPAEAWNAAQPVKIVIELPQAFSPHEAGLGADKRVLGLAFGSLQFQETSGTQP